MTPEAQQQSIAKALGRCIFKGTGKRERRDSTVSEFCVNCGQPFGYHELPDYLHDRRAMWDAAEAAGEGTIKAMRYWLFTICGEMKAHHATAAQEAEAFLRAKGSWVE